MSTKKYTFVIVDSEKSKQRTFELKRGTLISLIVLSILIVASVLGSYAYFIPKMMEYSKLSGELSQIAGNKTQYIQLIEDFREMQAFNKYVRRMLGIRVVDLGDSSAIEMSDTLANLDDYTGSDVVVLGNIPNTMPVNGVITQNYFDDKAFFEDNHYGIDVANRVGSPIVAAAGGLIIFSGWTDILGNTIIIDHGEEYVTVYGHNDRNIVQQRQRVKRGETIALLGNTGISTGPHLHFEIWSNGIPLDPKEMVSEYNQE